MRASANTAPTIPTLRFAETSRTSTQFCSGVTSCRVPAANQGVAGPAAQLFETGTRDVVLKGPSAFSFCPPIIDLHTGSGRSIVKTMMQQMRLWLSTLVLGCGPGASFVVDATDVPDAAPTIIADSGVRWRPDGGPKAGHRENVAPVAIIATSPPEVVSGAELILDGSRSFDPDGTVQRHDWSIETGGERRHLAEGAIAIMTVPSGVTYFRIRLSVADDTGETTESDPAYFRVRAPGAPVVDAGDDQIIDAGELIRLEGSLLEQHGDALATEWTQVAGPDVELSDAHSLRPTFIAPAESVRTLAFELNASDSIGRAEPDRISLFPTELIGTDSDHDFLSDTDERTWGTDPAATDTDDDGIPDGWEVHGHKGIDYRALGCNPLHRDVLVEIHAQEAVSMVHELFAHWQNYYASLAVPNVDSRDGIAFHFVVGSSLPDDYVCETNVFSSSFPFRQSGQYRDTFHFVQLCRNDVGTGLAEQIPGHRMSLNAPPLNADPTDNLSEFAAYQLYALFLHEMGHNLGLQHGGESTVNWKPNYPSYMNYLFFHTWRDSGSIADSPLTLSNGSWPSVDECMLLERGAFAGAPPTALALSSWTIMEDGSVDWNRDEVISDAPYEAVIRSVTFDPLMDTPGCQLLDDHNDLERIAASMSNAIPAGR